ncbi:MAG: non-lysosomal glucosylceramidase [Clostridia bacterium]|nr:non-lysosomal glucosylceramidase [Clostridia bacterium]
MKTYTGDYAQEIRFPLSGIGTGGLSISGTGQLTDWELDGRANKGTANGYSHFAIKAERNGEVIDARVLHGDVTCAMGGTALASCRHSWGYGQGLNRTTLAGLSHFPDVEFSGEFPFAKLIYSSEKMPAEISLCAFNPFIPGDEDNSSLPAAFFNWELKNTSCETTDYTLALSVGNPVKITNGGRCEFEKNGGISSLTMKSVELSKEDNSYGELLISTDCDNVSCQQYWLRSGWFDDVTTFWREFSSPGSMKNRIYNDNDTKGQFDVGDMCTLSAQITLKPGEKKIVRFVMAWYFPHFVKYWDSEKPVWNHEYVRRFSCAADVTGYCWENSDMLLEKSALFSKALMGMTLPDCAAEAAADNLCVLKSPVCLRLENGEFWGFEGTGAHDGSCEGTCDHVWGYQYALPFLFPRLARGMLETDYTYNMKESGEMMFRTMLPLGSPKMNFRACVDGQMGCVLRFYREWKLSGDNEWLKKWWSKVKKSIEYAWSSENRDKWDPDKSGVITGRQHHTLDVELFGANAWLTGFYLAALKAGAQMAEFLGEADTAREYREIFSRGCGYVEKELFNGRHYIQKIDLNDKAVLDPYAENDPGIYRYWNEENGELKYQTGDGCEIDQLLGQWHASIIGLGDIFDSAHRARAARALYETNFVSMRDVFNPCRIFAANSEKGMSICAWDENVYKPKIPVPYTEECMTGFEYAAAGVMIQNGMVQEGTRVICAIRDRYDGKKRNPFSEIECGAFYARSMASFSLPAVFSGYSFDMVKKEIGFAPVISEVHFSSFWAVDGAWGTVLIEENKLTLFVLDGKIALNSFRLPSASPVSLVFADGNTVLFRKIENRIIFDKKTDIFCRLVIEKQSD